MPPKSLSSMMQRMKPKEREKDQAIEQAKKESAESLAKQEFEFKQKQKAERALKDEWIEENSLDNSIMNSSYYFRDLNKEQPAFVKSVVDRVSDQLLSSGFYQELSTLTSSHDLKLFLDRIILENAPLFEEYHARELEKERLGEDFMKLAGIDATRYSTSTAQYNRLKARITAIMQGMTALFPGLLLSTIKCQIITDKILDGTGWDGKLHLLTSAEQIKKQLYNDIGDGSFANAYDGQYKFLKEERKKGVEPESKSAYDLIIKKVEQDEESMFVFKNAAFEDMDTAPSPQRPPSPPPSPPRKPPSPPKERTRRSNSRERGRERDYGRDTRRGDSRERRDTRRGDSRERRDTRRGDSRERRDFARDYERGTRRGDSRERGDFARDYERGTRRGDSRDRGDTRRGDFARDYERGARRGDSRDRGDRRRGGFGKTMKRRK
jgi:hypothetical protein